MSKIENSFGNWLKETYKQKNGVSLPDEKVNKSIGALNTVSKAIQQDVYAMKPDALASIFDNHQDLKARNDTGNRMYSSAINRLIEYKNSTENIDAENKNPKMHWRKALKEGVKYYLTPAQIAEIETAQANYIAMLDEMLEAGELNAKEAEAVRQRKMLQPSDKNKTIEDLFYDDSRTYNETTEQHTYFNKQITITLPNHKNPRQVCTHGHVSWETIRRAGGVISYREYKRLGGRHREYKNTGRGNDLHWDIDKGHVTIDDLTEATLQKEQQESAARLNPVENNQPPKGVEQPRRTKQTIIAIDRDPAIIACIKGNANGICELCTQPAPFKNKDDSPFLEIHHVKNLADGGSDTLSNTVAICPNCHRALHYADNKDDLTQQLYDNIDRLERE